MSQRHPKACNVTIFDAMKSAHSCNNPRVFKHTYHIKTYHKSQPTLGSIIINKCTCYLLPTTGQFYSKKIKNTSYYMCQYETKN